MKKSFAKKKIEELLTNTNIKINSNGQCDIKVHDEKFYDIVLKGGSLGLGESYMDGLWDCDCLDGLFDKILTARLQNKVSTLTNFMTALSSRIFNMQTKARSKKVAQIHYDVGNDLYFKMLDSLMLYSCGYWQNATNLVDAQKAKLDLIACKLNLKPNQKVLDIGCGWGGAAKYMADTYGVSVTGVTISKEQAKLAMEKTKNSNVKIILNDYRNLSKDEKFDAIYSIGMFEHVGYKNYKSYIKKANELLEDEGRFLLHTIGSNTTTTFTDPWINQYIFPGGMLPSIAQIGKSIEDYFVMEDWHNFGQDYDTTLMAWRDNFVASWDSIKENYDERFYRMWYYYLSICAGSFRSRYNQLWQILLIKNGSKQRIIQCR